MPHFNIKVTPEQISRGLSKPELIDFIVDIDTDISEVDFTINLLNRLIDELSLDEPKEWIADQLGFSIKRKKTKKP